ARGGGTGGEGSARGVGGGARPPQPTNENISVVAALPTDNQRGGMTGPQLPARAAAADPATATTTTTVSTLTRTSCAAALARSPPAARAMTVSSSAAATAARASWPPPVSSVR